MLAFPRLHERVSSVTSARAASREALGQALEWLRARPILDLEMRLGEGTGAALAMSTIESALDLFHEMATFQSASVSGKIR